MEIEWYKYMKEGVNNEMKGETNAWLKQGDTPVKQGDMLVKQRRYAGCGSRLQQVHLKAISNSAVMTIGSTFKELPGQNTNDNYLNGMEMPLALDRRWIGAAGERCGPSRDRGLY